MTVQELYTALAQVATGVQAVRALALGQAELTGVREAELSLLLTTLARWQAVQQPGYWFERVMPVYEWWAIQQAFERVERELATAAFEQVFRTAQGLGELVPLVIMANERPALQDAMRDALLRAGIR
ncbi:MAG: hypothetical protein N2651_00750 [Fimbriimonadales bacterium]|nr:hypothetical protein [Fimbriimonadales bacterium]